jgi:uncharacterized protein YaeQ
MALKATIYKASLGIADMDRNYYADHALTLAQHPSETDERMMIRLLAFALNADDNLTFTRGLSTDDEPELWVKDLTGHITLWIELGLPDEDRIRKASNRADKVIVYAYGGRQARIWWDKHGNKLERYNNVTVINLPEEATAELPSLMERTMTLQVNIQDGDVTLGNENRMLSIRPEYLGARD